MRSELLCLIGNHDQCDKSYDYTDKRFVTISCMASGEKITESHREDVPVSIKFGSAPDSWDINED